MDKEIRFLLIGVGLPLMFVAAMLMSLRTGNVGWMNKLGIKTWDLRKKKQAADFIKTFS